jgi:hypothetical protein
MTYFKRLIFISFLLTLFISTNVNAQTDVQSPEQYLGYKLGEHFTPHHNVLGYFKQVAEASPLVSYEKYGGTNEGRELGIVKVSSEENNGRLKEIRTDNLKRTGLMEGENRRRKDPHCVAQL